MQRHTLYAHVDGSDLEDVAAPIEESLADLAARPAWVTSRPAVVNRKTNVSGARPDDLPDRDLGINLALPDPGDEPDSWFGDVVRVAGHLAKLHSGRHGARRAWGALVMRGVSYEPTLLW
ncbi:hypothetical protein J2W96_005803 [Variovorax guangxiensis]|nr:hypothetical protein [Variovorax guangxiensis]